MATYVLVHGLWHGGWCWTRLASLLREAGHTVFTPTLSGLGERSHRRRAVDWNVHVRDVLNVLEFEDLQEVVLVGHSHGGCLILNVADTECHRLSRLVCLDSWLPAHGQSFREAFPRFYHDLLPHAYEDEDGEWLRPPPDWQFGVDAADVAWLQERLRPHPLHSLHAPLCFASAPALALPRHYIRFLGGDGRKHDQVADERWTHEGWIYTELAAGHDAMISAAPALAEQLLHLVGESSSHSR